MSSPSCRTSGRTTCEILRTMLRIGSLHLADRPRDVSSCDVSPVMCSQCALLWGQQQPVNSVKSSHCKQFNPRFVRCHDCSSTIGSCKIDGHVVRLRPSHLSLSNASLSPFSSLRCSLLCQPSGMLMSRFTTPSPLRGRASAIVPQCSRTGNALTGQQITSLFIVRFTERVDSPLKMSSAFAGAASGKEGVSLLTPEAQKHQRMKEFNTCFVLHLGSLEQ